jgi:hypothetical protein
MGSTLKVYNIPLKYIKGFVQHLEPRACVDITSVVFQPQLKLRCVIKDVDVFELPCKKVCCGQCNSFQRGPIFVTGRIHYCSL